MNLQSQRPVPPSGEQVELTCGEQRAVVVEVGGALRSYVVSGHELLDGYGAQERCTDARGHSLIPWPNRRRDGRYRFGGAEHQLPLTEPAKHGAIHGLVRWANWSVAERSQGRARMEHVLHPQSGWAFALALAIDYALSDDGLTVSTTATNVGDRACPYGAGAHPYLTLGTEQIDTLTLEAPGQRHVPPDDRGIPPAPSPWTRQSSTSALRASSATPSSTPATPTCAVARIGGLGWLADPDGDRGVTLWLDERYEYLMLFTGDSLPEPARRRRGLGVEPMTCAPNALQSGDGCGSSNPASRSPAPGASPRNKQPSRPHARSSRRRRADPAPRPRRAPASRRWRAGTIRLEPNREATASAG